MVGVFLKWAKSPEIQVEEFGFLLVGNKKLLKLSEFHFYFPSNTLF